MVTVMKAKHTVLTDIDQREESVRERERIKRESKGERERDRESIYCNCVMVSTTQDILRCSSFL